MFFFLNYYFYLTNRRHRVIIDGSSSCWKPVTSGVPQSSLIFPILFLIYINDIGSRLSEGTMLPLYTDGTKCCKVTNSPRDCIILQDDLFPSLTGLEPVVSISIERRTLEAALSLVVGKFFANIKGRHVMSVSGHINESSIKGYRKTDVNTKTSMAGNPTLRTNRSRRK